MDPAVSNGQTPRSVSRWMQSLVAACSLTVKIIAMSVFALVAFAAIFLPARYYFWNEAAVDLMSRVPVMFLRSRAYYQAWAEFPVYIPSCYYFPVAFGLCLQFSAS